MKKRKFIMHVQKYVKFIVLNWVYSCLVVCFKAFSPRGGGGEGVLDPCLGIGVPPRV